MSATDRVMRGKKGTSGVHIMKTVQAIIVCVYHEPIVAEQVKKAAGKVHLKIFSYFSVPIPRKSSGSTLLVWVTRCEGYTGTDTTTTCF